ncbi:hypothetical protein Nepgr_002793 [Nepenthes gracilis]|uniref:Uncharacterized protein n=1 Tax=Nepenthes gracilis TaxID=150966 RepID=A0AAD3PA23_NEPGR|nr:hypothetical protein Nepgr_002793 [Nepenthes gracilis]
MMSVLSFDWQGWPNPPSDGEHAKLNAAVAEGLMLKQLMLGYYVLAVTICRVEEQTPISTVGDAYCDALKSCMHACLADALPEAFDLVFETPIEPWSSAYNIEC